LVREKFFSPLMSTTIAMLVIQTGNYKFNPVIQRDAGDGYQVPVPPIHFAKTLFDDFDSVKNSLVFFVPIYFNTAMLP